MTTPIQYRKNSLEILKAWFHYKNTKPLTSPSVVSFVAGYNAALATLQPKEPRMTISPEVETLLAKTVERWAEENLQGLPEVLAHTTYLALRRTLEEEADSIQKTFGPRETI